MIWLTVSKWTNFPKCQTMTGVDVNLLSVSAFIFSWCISLVFFVFFCFVYGYLFLNFHLSTNCFSAVRRPSSRSWMLSPSTFLRRNLSASCQAKLHHDSAAQRVSGPSLAQRLVCPPPTQFWLSSVKISSCCQTWAASRRGWWRLLRPCRPTSSPGLRLYSVRYTTSWRNTLWRFCLAQSLPSMPTTLTMTTYRRPSHPMCSLGSGVYRGRVKVLLL